MKGFLRRIRPSWIRVRLMLAGALLLLLVIIFFIWRLQSITPGLGPEEYASRENLQSPADIIKRGVNAPYYLVQYGLSKLPIGEVTALRTTSVVLGMTIFAALLIFLKNWFGRLIATAAGFIFITTPWVALTIRTATPNVLLLWPIVLMALFVLTSRSKKLPALWWLLLCAAVGLGLYIPGVILLVAAAAAINRAAFSQLTAKVNAVALVSGLTLIVLLALPLAGAIALEPASIKQLLFIPSGLAPVLELLSSVGWSAAALFWQTRDHVDIGLGRLPVLNILQIALMIFGLYALSARAKRVTYSMLGLLIFSIVVAGVNHHPHLLLFGLPSVAVFIAAGLRYLFIEWRRVFPLNPFAYGLAITMVSLIMVAHLLYAARYTLVAWPQATETKSTYVLK